MTIETINKRILEVCEAIEIAQDNNELARLDNELEELELLRLDIELFGDERE